MGEPVSVLELQFEIGTSDHDALTEVKKNCEGQHHSISDVLSEKPESNYVIGRIIEKKKRNDALCLKKYILREVLPNEEVGNAFALFGYGEISSMPANVGDFVVIHNPEISKSCLINFLHLLEHKYEYQVAVGRKNKENSTPEESNKLVQLMKIKDYVSNTNQDLEKRRESLLPSSTPIVSRNNHALEELEGSIDGDESTYPDLDNTKMMYTKLVCITSSSRCINLIGVIVSVKPGSQQDDSNNHLKIYLEDESNFGEKFLLNLVSDILNVPPLHSGYILRAKNVLVQSEEEGIVGWVRCGKLIATVENDLSKPITLLTTEKNPTLSYEEKQRIIELRNFSMLTASNINWKNNHEKSKSDEEDVQQNLMIETNDTVSEEIETFTLKYYSSDSDE